MNVDSSSEHAVPPPQLSETSETQYPVPETVVDEADFRRREANAVAIGTAIGHVQKKLRGMWDRLMPEIYPVWSHRSKRGDDHVKGQRKSPEMESETWTPYLRSFCAKTGLNPKVVERHVMAYRVKVLGLPPQPSARKKAEKTANPVLSSTGDRASDHQVDADPVETDVRSHHAPRGRIEFAQPAAVKVSIEEGHDQEVDSTEEDENFPSCPRTDENVPLKPGDRSGLLQRIIQKCGPDFKSVLAELPPDEQARILDFIYNGITNSCSPAVRRGSVIKASAEYIAPPLQARKGEPLYRAN